MKNHIPPIFDNLKEWFSEVMHDRKEDLAAYLQDEIKWLPTRVEVKQLASHISELEKDLNDLEARLQKQETKECVG